MDFTNPDIAVMALVAILVVKEAVSFLWPIIRPSASPNQNILDEIKKEVSRLHGAHNSQISQMAEVLRSVHTLLEHDNKKFDLVRGILERTKDLWEWHNVSDSKTGGKLWYVPQQLQENMTALLQVSQQQTETMKDLDRTMKAFLDSQSELLRKLEGGR